MISAYCLSYGNWTVIPSQWEHDFADMAACGFDAVALSYSESEERYAQRCFEQQVKAAQRHGLKVLAIPSRIGGRFAGAPFMPSFWLLDHPASQQPGRPGLARLEDPVFLRWVEGFLRKIVEDFGVDGLIWDEPKGLDLPMPTLEETYRSTLDFLQHLTDFVLGLRKDLDITLFNMPKVPAEFTARAAKLRGLSSAGFDGRCCRESYFHEEPVYNKTFIRDCWPRTVAECAGHTGTFALIENILIPDVCIPEFEEEYLRTLREIRPDHLSVYYYGHNNESPERIQKFCMENLKKYCKGERL